MVNKNFFPRITLADGSNIHKISTHFCLLSNVNYYSGNNTCSKQPKCSYLLDSCYGLFLKSLSKMAQLILRDQNTSLFPTSFEMAKLFTHIFCNFSAFKLMHLKTVFVTFQFIYFCLFLVVRFRRKQETFLFFFSWKVQEHIWNEQCDPCCFILPASSR